MTRFRNVGSSVDVLEEAVQTVLGQKQLKMAAYLNIR